MCFVLNQNGTPSMLQLFTHLKYVRCFEHMAGETIGIVWEDMIKIWDWRANKTRRCLRVASSVCVMPDPYTLVYVARSGADVVVSGWDAIYDTTRVLHRFEKFEGEVGARIGLDTMDGNVIVQWHDQPQDSDLQDAPSLPVYQWVYGRV
jgi:hypothetical protein